MSRSKRKDLGLSGREYEEAIILERIFTLTKHNRCVTCLVRLQKSTHVDPERLNLLCASCASRRPYKIQIGRDHLSMHILEKLEAIYRDPYGYEIPVNHEMPGMSSMMARERRGQTVTPTYTNNGWPVVQSTKGTEYDSAVQHNGRMYPGATNGNHPAIRQNHMEITVPLRKKDANNVPRTHSTNPFANSESRMNTNPMSKPMFDRDDYRFNMSNMRSALNDTTDLQKYGAAAMQSNYDAPARGNVRPIANYGSVYERRVPR
nr:P30 [Babesia gibsoni]